MMQINLCVQCGKPLDHDVYLNEPYCYMCKPAPALKLLVGVIVYDRVGNIDLWTKAWAKLTKTGDAKLLFVHNQPEDSRGEAIRAAIQARPHDYFFSRKNEGYDIGALRDVIREGNKFGDWDVLLWCVDDNIPVHRDILPAFMRHFEDPEVGLVGNYWVKGDFYKHYHTPVANHIRTSCFAIRRNVALKLVFPRPLTSKAACYKFEWADPLNNLTAQVLGQNKKVLPVSNDWSKCWTDSNEYIWDIGALNPDAYDPRCRRNYWAAYENAFLVQT